MVGRERDEDLPVVDGTDVERRVAVDVLRVDLGPEVQQMLDVLDQAVLTGLKKRFF